MTQETRRRQAQNMFFWHGRYYNSYFCLKGAFAPCDAWLPWQLESLGPINVSGMKGGDVRQGLK